MRPVDLLDTNVWISAFLNPSGPPARVKDAWLDGDFTVVTTLPLLDELGEVLRRPRLKRKYKIQEDDIAKYLQLIAARATLVTVSRHIVVCRDPDDNIVLDGAIAGGAGFVVSRDDDLKGDVEVVRQMREYGVQVVSVSRFLTIPATGEE